ncbi:uncharacterized protein [Eurosta solidaginis]|uniref:uncharacterized protein n=1 Tax=Eurosta solidaginis TaxID=178769 RepID=UPI00353138C2
MTSELETTILQNTSVSSNVMSPEEEALQSLCKQLLKSKVFRGFYEERRYVDVVSDYRDVIGLHRCEREFESFLIDIHRQINLFYKNNPFVWIGITHGPYLGAIQNKYTSGTHIWLQLEDVAFGQYWFNVKSVRFRKNEVILKVKVVRAVEDESPMIEKLATPSRSKPPAWMHNSHEQKSSTLLANNATKPINFPSQLYREQMNASADSTEPKTMQIGYEDFVNVMRDWGATMKHSMYNFMSNDINKDNIKNILKFLGLVVVTLLAGSVEAVKYLGAFTLRFMQEFTRFTHVMTPIILKVLEMINKIIGGFFLLLAIIWQDIFGRRKMPQQYSRIPATNERTTTDLRAIEYNQPLYHSIQYSIRQDVKPAAYRPNSMGPFTEFERKLQ